MLIRFICCLATPFVDFLTHHFLGKVTVSQATKLEKVAKLRSDSTFEGESCYSFYKIINTAWITALLLIINI